MQLTARLKIPYPDLNGDDTPVDIPQVWFNRAVILDGLAPITEGPLAGRPVSTSGTPGIAGRFYVTTDQPDSPRLDLDTGTAWVTVGPARVDAAANIASLRTLGTGAQQAAAGNDARLIGGGNASGDITGTYPGPLTVATWGGLTKSQVVAGNTPQAHAGSHAPAGSDAISGLTDASIAATNKDGAAGLASMRTLGAGAQQAMAGNATPTPAAHATTHKYGGADPLVSLKPTPQNANYSAVAGDLVLMTGSNNTVTLPNAPSVDGAQCAVMAISANVTVNRAGTDTITTTAQGQLTVAVTQGTTVVFTYHSGVWYGIVSGGSSGGASGLVPLNPPSRAYRAAAVSLGNGAATKIPFDTSSFDPIGAFDLTTNHRYNVQTAGYYLIEGGVQLTGLSAGNGISVMIYKNGAEISDGNYAPGLGYEVTDVIQCSAGDYIEIFVWNGSGATLNTVANKPAGTYLTVSQIAQVGSPPAGQGLTTAARAYRNAAMNSSASAFAKIPFDAIQYDPGSNFSIANGRYIAPATGYYSVTGQVAISTGAANDYLLASIFVNGVERTRGTRLPVIASSGQLATIEVADTVYLQAGDYVELDVFTNGVDVVQVGTTWNTWIAVHQIAGSSIFGALSPTAQNAPYAAGAGQLVLMTGANAVTLPNAPIPGSQIEVLALTAAVPVNRAGTDTINNSGVAGLQSLTVQAGQSTIFSYLNGVWYASPVGGGQALAPPARAYRNAAFGPLTASTWTKIPLDTKSFDPGGNMDVVTNGRYNVPTAGIYRVSFGGAVTATADGQTLIAAIWKNGSQWSVGSLSQASGAGSIWDSGSDNIQLNAGDYLELYIWASAALNVSATYSFLAVEQIGVTGAPSPGQGLSTAFSARSSATVQIGGGAQYAKVPLGTIDYDTGNNFSTVNSRFTAPASGYYLIVGGVGNFSGAAPDGSLLGIAIYKNGAGIAGSLEATSSSQTGTGGFGMNAVTDGIIQLNAGDYVELWGSLVNSSGGQIAVPTASGWLQGVQVGGTNLVGALSPTAQSADYTAGAGQLVLMSGTHTVTLPSAPMNGSQVAIKALSGVVTVSRGGTDTITGGNGGQSGIATFNLPQSATATLTYFGGTWYLEADDVTAITVAVLPTNAVDGQECFFLADGPNGIVWNLRYRAASVSSHKWEYIGGSEMFIDNGAYSQTIISASTWVAAPATPGTITLPVNGDYEIEFGGSLLNNSAGNGVTPLLCLGLNGAAWSPSVYGGQFTSIGVGLTGSRKYVATGRVANDVLSLMVQTNNLNATLVAPFVRVRPIRLG